MVGLNCVSIGTVSKYVSEMSGGDLSIIIFTKNLYAANKQPEGRPFKCHCRRTFCRDGDGVRHKRFSTSHTECPT